MTNNFTEYVIEIQTEYKARVNKGTFKVFTFLLLYIYIFCIYIIYEYMCGKEIIHSAEKIFPSRMIATKTLVFNSSNR